MNYRKYVQSQQTPQCEPVLGLNQVENNAGGYVFELDIWKRLDRFLILGSEGGTYYVGEKELTQDNAKAVLACIQADGTRVVRRCVEISESGRAPKNDPALFVLAMCAGLGSVGTKKAALKVLQKVARIGTHLFHFIEYLEGFRGWSRQSRRAVANWYNNQEIDDLAYQVIKYQQRDGWSNRDLLRLSHPKTNDPVRNNVYRWIVGKPTDIGVELPVTIKAFEVVKKAERASTITESIRKYNLPRETIPTQWLNDVSVWNALLRHMSLNALIRNLGKMTSIELLQPMSTAVNWVIKKLSNKEYIHKSRLHPLAILIALKQYESGHGDKGKLTWEPVSQIVDALNDAFYLAFQNVEPTGKRIMLSLDVSGSMSESFGGTNVSCCEGASAMALITARNESNYMITRFNKGIETMPISPRQRLDDVLKYTKEINGGGTDCALPMLYALGKNIPIDAFCVYTDFETWAGNIHPFQALEKYRKKMGIDAKLIVVGMASTGFSIANPNDAGMLDIVGFDAATPSIIADFIKN